MKRAQIPFWILGTAALVAGCSGTGVQTPAAPVSLTATPAPSGTPATTAAPQPNVTPTATASPAPTPSPKGPATATPAASQAPSPMPTAPAACPPSLVDPNPADPPIVDYEYTLNPLGGTLVLPSFYGYVADVGYPAYAGPSGTISTCVTEDIQTDSGYFLLNFVTLGNPGTLQFAVGGANSAGKIGPGVVTVSITSPSYKIGDVVDQSFDQSQSDFTLEANVTSYGKSGGVATFQSPFDELTVQNPSGDALDINYVVISTPPP